MAKVTRKGKRIILELSEWEAAAVDLAIMNITCDGEEGCEPDTLHRLLGVRGALDTVRPFVTRRKLPTAELS